MDIDCFYNELHKYKKACLLINDVEINPIEIIVIVKNKKELWQHLNKSNNGNNSERILIGKRVVRVYSFRELCLNKCFNNLIERGVEVRPNVHQLCQADLIPVLMVLISFSFFHDCFLKEHYTQIVHQFLLNNGYEGISYHSFFRESFHSKMENRMRTVLVEKARRKLSLLFIKNEIAKELSKQDAYIDKLLREQVITKEGKQIEESEGKSHSVLFEDIWNGNHVFIKGKGYSKYNSAENEIEAYKVLNHCNCDWLLDVYAYSEENCWVAYPYIQETYLDKLIATRKLSAKELNVLYEFLIKALDGLMQYGVLHNDFRFENIIAVLDERQELASCKLYDFGCASANGMYPWDKNNFVSKEVGMMVSGNYRFSSDYMDDAASAYLIFIHAGGDAQSKEAKEIYGRIGRQFAYTNYGILDHIIII